MEILKESMSRFGLKTFKSKIPRFKITQSSDAHTFIRDFYDNDIEIYESVFILLLNNSNITIGFAKISQGGITGSLIDIRIVAKYCVEALATGCILAHNHPSGKLEPSRADVDITLKVRDALKLFEINLLDHLIITVDGFYSLKDSGKF